MADNGFIKLHKKMLKWEWYDDNNTKIVFLHCLLRANWEGGSWHGINYGAGQFITSLPNLADETHLSVQNVRTALSHLKSTGEITDDQQGNCRLITVVKWNEYQGTNRRTNRPLTDDQQTSNRPLTVDKEYKEKEEEKEVKEVKNIYGEYKHVRLTDKERDRLFNDYGENETLEAIKFLDEYKERKGYKSKNDNLTLRDWVFDAVKKRKGQGNTNSFQGQTTQQPQSLAEKWGLKE